MSLIRCPECKTEISSLAPNCPKCGCPVAKRRDIEAAGTQITTTQQTAKKFKGHMLIGGAICCLGVVLMVSNDYSPAGAGFFLVGIVWYAVARARAWWNNG
jgi:hypothetical protein